MADDHPPHDPLKDLYLFVAFVVVVVILWYASGGPARADLRGVFLGAPTEAGGTGAAYGPQFPTQNDTGPTDAQSQAAQFQTGTVAPPGSVSTSSDTY